MNKPLIIVKIGSSAITTDGNLDLNVVKSIVKQVASLHDKFRFVIVSSGAVANGKKYLSNFQGKTIERKAAAAIGNPILIAQYAEMFATYGIAISQSLCERHHFSERRQFLQLKDTFEELWANDIIPIANENDVVSNYELKFSDNDELATLIAVGFGAEKLLLGTSVDGVYDEQNQVIPEVKSIDKEVFKYVKKEMSSSGLGGMLSKLTYANLATKLGIETFIFNIKVDGNILLSVSKTVGTRCIPKEASLSMRKKWLASSSKLSGKVIIDKGAIKALLSRKSLLAVGVKEILSDFDQYEAIEILSEEKELVAIAIAKIDSNSFKLSGKDVIIAHSDDIVLL